MIIFIALIILIFVAVSFIIKRIPSEKWKVIYFSIADDLNSGTDEDKIVIKLQKRHNILEDDANKAITAVKEGNEEWFKEKIK